MPQIKIGTLRALWSWWNDIPAEKLWVGTDALTLNETPPHGDWRWLRVRLPLHRLKWRILGSFVTHYYGCDRVYQDLKTFYFGRSILYHKVEYDLLYPVPVDKTKPVVMIHMPEYKRNRGYKDWIYGIDIAEKAVEIDSVYWIPIGIKGDIRGLLSKVDACVIPKRAIGIPRLKRECELNGIPVYYEPENPNVESIQRFLESLNGYNDQS